MQEFMMQHRNENTFKKIYEKPRLRVIELSAEEVLGVSCKANPTVDAKAGTLIHKCGLPACSSSGGS
jgi:hypothetical protein